MALFGDTSATVGIDIGTSSLKLVELVNRRRRIEVATYAQAEVTNVLVDPSEDEAKAISFMADLLARMMEQAEVSSDIAIAALPSSVVFSAVIPMPQIPEKEMDKAVQFAARDIVPADLDDMVLGWSRVASDPHMSTDDPASHAPEEKSGAIQLPGKSDQPVPVFITAAPQVVVNRYLAVMRKLKLRLLALEVETFPLVRSLLQDAAGSALIVDIGDLATTFHIIDAGTPRVSHTMDFGGHEITAAIAQAMGVAIDKAEAAKAAGGVTAKAGDAQRQATESAVRKQAAKAKNLLALYQQKEQRAIKRTVLIGGGANLPGLKEFWTKEVGHETQIGNPWRGLSYPQQLESRLQILGPTYGVAVGLAMRGLPTS